LYDNDGLLTQAGAFTIERDAETGWPTSVYDTATTVMTVTPSYNAYGEVTGAVTTVDSIEVASWDVTYDNAGRITTKTETVGGTAATYAYSYDAMSRLTEVSRNGLTVEEYSYDCQGRRLETDENYPSRTISDRAATYNDAEGGDDRLETSGDYAYAYDPDGFLAMRTDTVTLETTTYDYTRSGQLNSVTLHQGLPEQTLIEYVHNAAGQRVAKKVNDVITEKYLWAGITGLLAVYDGDNNLLMRFEGAKMVKGGQTYYLITDQVGTVRAVVDASGAIVKEITYDSFGNVLDDTAPTFAIPLGFASGLHDRDTGLVHFGFRDYDPDSGTWTAKDPVLFASGDIYLYGYCLADAVNLADPSGLSWLFYYDPSGTLTYVPANGQAIQTFPARNVVDSGSRGKWPPGVYPYSGYNRHPERDANSDIGSHGIFIFDLSSRGRYAMGVHSGQANRGGINHATMGCIRTTDDAMSSILAEIQGSVSGTDIGDAIPDPLTGIAAIDSSTVARIRNTAARIRSAVRSLVDGFNPFGSNVFTHN